MSSLTYLITGANRGIGKALLETYLLRPNTTVIAAVRNPSTSTPTLSSLPLGTGSKLIIIKIEADSPNGPFSAVKELKSTYGVEVIDVVIANAGIMPTGAILPVLQTSTSSVLEIFTTNTLSILHLAQAFFPLLLASKNNPRFLAITSTIGSIESLGKYNVPFFAYGMSKAASNYLVTKLHWENEGVSSAAFNPGWVKTDMGNGAAEKVGMKEAPVELGDSVKGLVEQFDGMGRERSGGFWSQEGERIPW